MGVKALNQKIDTVERPTELSELDDFAETFPDASPFQTGSIVKIYNRTSDAKPIVLAVRDSRGSLAGSIVGITFSHGGPSAWFLHRITTHCTIRGTPLAKPSAHGTTAVFPLVSRVLAQVPSHTLYVRWYPDREDATVRAFQELGFVREDWLNYVLDIGPNEARILDGMSKHRRKGIRAAEKVGLEISEVRNQHSLDALYGILERSHSRLRLPIQSRGVFEAVLDELVPRGRALMLLASSEEGLIAARVILVHRTMAYDWYAGALPIAERVHADELLVWEGIRRARALGATTFDFGGAGIPSQPYGPREFKRRFGGVETNTGRYTKVLRPTLFRLVEVAAGLRGKR